MVLIEFERVGEKILEQWDRCEVEEVTEWVLSCTETVRRFYGEVS